MRDVQVSWAKEIKSLFQDQHALQCSVWLQTLPVTIQEFVLLYKKYQSEYFMLGYMRVVKVSWKKPKLHIHITMLKVHIHIRVFHKTVNFCTIYPVKCILGTAWVLLCWCIYCRVWIKYVMSFCHSQAKINYYQPVLIADLTMVEILSSVDCNVLYSHGRIMEFHLW